MIKIPFTYVKLTIEPFNNYSKYLQVQYEGVMVLARKCLPMLQIKAFPKIKRVRCNTPTMR